QWLLEVYLNIFPAMRLAVFTTEDRDAYHRSAGVRFEFSESFFFPVCRHFYLWAEGVRRSGRGRRPIFHDICKMLAFIKPADRRIGILFKTGVGDNIFQFYFCGRLTETGKSKNK